MFNADDADEAYVLHTFSWMHVEHGETDTGT